MHEIIIVGASIAGLTLANRLAEAGCQDVLLLEAEQEIKPKFQPPLLWPGACGIPALLELEQTVKTVHLFFQNERFEAPLSQPLGVITRQRVQEALLKRATALGVQMSFGTRVERVEGGKELSLAGGRSVKAKRLGIATTRHGYDGQRLFPRYLGLQAHVQLPPSEAIELYLLPGAYLGAIDLEGGWTHLACLARYDERGMEDPARFMQQLIEQSAPLMRRLKDDPIVWSATPLPRCGLKPLPHWPNTCFVGHALAVLPPLTGGDMALEMATGAVAAPYLMSGEVNSYRTLCAAYLTKKIWLAECLHHSALSSKLQPLAFSLIEHYPKLLNRCFRHIARLATLDSYRPKLPLWERLKPKKYRMISG